MKIIKYIFLVCLLIPGLKSYTKTKDTKIAFKKADDTGVTEKQIKHLIKASNQFALKLYSYLSSKNPDKNMFFSPYSIFTAASMAYEGSGGQTADEIRSTFYFSKNHITRRLAIANIYNQLNSSKADYQLLTGNALWIQENLQSKIFNDIQKYYGAKVFINTPAKDINRWIENKTMNKFKNVIQDCEPTENRLCGLSLINTIYFKGDWAQKFKKTKTRKKPFIVNSEKKVRASMMNMTESFNYMETKTMQLLEMPYKGEELFMLILLPKDFEGMSKKNFDSSKISMNSKATDSNSLKADTTKNLKKSDLAFLETKLTEKNLNQWRNTLRKREVEIHIPKFTFKKNYDLSETLKPHMPLAFDQKKADFSAFDENLKKKNFNLYIKNIIHKSFIDVDEEGTEAAAVTSVAFRTLASIPPPPAVFKADHPFIFLIQDRKTGYILFIGKVADPTTRG